MVVGISVAIFFFNLFYIIHKPTPRKTDVLPLAIILLKILELKISTIIFPQTFILTLNIALTHLS